MTLIRVSIEDAQSLAVTLGQWGNGVDGARGLIAQAETLSGISSGALSLIGVITETGQSLSLKIENAVAELTGFRIDLRAAAGTIHTPTLPAALSVATRQDMESLATSRPLALEAARLVSRVRESNEMGMPASFEDRRRLAELFEIITGDPSLAYDAQLLALRGYQIDEALALRTHERLYSVYDYIAGAMVAGQSPAEAGLPAGLFPSAYRAWHAQHAVIEEQVAQVQAKQPFLSSFDVKDFVSHDGPALRDRDANQLVGFGSDRFPLDGGGTSVLGAVSGVATFYPGHASDPWLGHALTDAIGGDWSTDDILRASGIVMHHDDVAVGFFHGLGAQGTAAIPQQLASRDAALAASAVPVLAQALANVSGRPIGFGGRDLIEADTGRYGASDNRRSSDGYAELMLQAATYEPSFLIDAAIASLELRPDDLDNWSGGMSFTGSAVADPRTIPLAAVAENGYAPWLVSELEILDKVDLLIDPATPFHATHESALVAGIDPISAVIGLAGSEPTASLVLTRSMQQLGGYGSNPRGSSKARDGVTLDDPRIAEGASAMLYVAAPDYVGQPEKLQAYYDSYDLVVRSGAGEELALAGGSTVFGDTIQAQLEAGESSLDLAAVNEFQGTIEAIRADGRLQAGLDKDRDITNLERTLGVLSLVTPGVASRGLTAAGLAVPSGTNAYQVVRQQNVELLQADDLLQLQALAATFDSGVATTAEGQMLAIEIYPDDAGFRLSTASGSEFASHLGPMNTLPFDFASQYPYSEIVVRVDGTTTTLADVYVAVDQADGAIGDAQQREAQTHAG